MPQPSLERKLLEQFSQLGQEQKQQVLDFARTLTVIRPRGVPGKELLQFAGVIDPAELQTMDRAIHDDCERIDPDEW